MVEDIQRDKQRPSLQKWTTSASQRNTQQRPVARYRKTRKRAIFQSGSPALTRRQAADNQDESLPSIVQLPDPFGPPPPASSTASYYRRTHLFFEPQPPRLIPFPRAQKTLPKIPHLHLLHGVMRLRTTGGEERNSHMRLA